ncbi:MAG: hypothetical protein ACLFOY_05500 [Desulfatibacillaceae bacterium]
MRTARMSMLGLAVLALVLYSGCATKTVYLDGYLDPDAQASLASGSEVCVVTPDQTPNPILAREIAAKIRYMLDTDGYRPVDECGEARYAVLFNYGVGEGRIVEDVWPVTRPSRDVIIGTSNPAGDTYVHIPGETVYVPYSRTVYDRWITLRLINAGPWVDNNTADDIWIGEAVIPGERGDLREAVNYMLPVLFDHFGQNTGAEVTATVRGDDPRVEALRGRAGR